MKKLLALVLALVMTMSLVTISNAAFKDANSIDYKEAVEVMNKVGVLIGDEKGNFNAKDTLTRGQAAKIVAYLDLGGKTADAIKGSGAVFTDVKATDWFAGYVEYCAGAGYVAGMGDKTFAPNEKVTGVQFAKMLLCALGYKAEVEGYTGSDYTIAIARDANKNDLFDGLSIVTSANLTREQAAKMAFNALKATVVEYQGGTNVTTSDGTSVIVNATRSEVANKSYDYDQSVEGYDKNGTQQLCEKLYGKDLKKDTDPDAFGRPATKWTYKNDEVGTYADEADYTYTAKVSKKALYNDLGKSVYDDLTAKNPTKFSVTEDGKPVDGARVADYLDKNSTAKIDGKTGNGTLTEVYVDDDNNVNVVIINTYVVKATDDYDSKKETVKIAAAGNVVLSLDKNTLSSDDFAVENVKEDDYLLVTCAGTGTTKTVKSVEPATVVTGNVDSYSNSSVTIAGTKYEYAVKADTSSTHGTAVTYEIGEDAKVVTDGTYILYVDEATVAADKYVYITEIAHEGNFRTSGDFQAKAYFLDGTQKTITLKDKYADNSAVDADEDVNTWFAYSVNSSDKYTLTKLSAGASENNTGSVASTTENGYKLTENGKVNVGAGQNGAVKANSATVFVVVDDDDNVTSYTGVSNVPTIKVKGGTAITAKYVMAKTAGYAKYVFIDAGDAAIDGATKGSSDFIYLLKWDSTGKDADKNDYYVYKALVNGEEKKISLNENFNAKGEGNCAIDTLYTDVKYDENGYVDSMNVADSGDDYVVIRDSAKIELSGASVNYADDVLTIDGKDFVVAKNCKIYLIAADSNVKEDAGSKYETTLDMSANSLYTTLKDYNGHIDGSYYAQVDDDSDTLTTLYVFVSNTNA